MNQMMVPTYLHVRICCFLLYCFPRRRFSFLVVIQFPHFSYAHIFPIIPFWFSMLHMSFLFGGYSIFPFFLLPHFPHFPLVVFNVAHVFFLVFVTTRPPFFPFGFVFSVRGEGRFDLGTVSPTPPPLRKNPRSSFKHWTPRPTSNKHQTHLNIIHPLGYTAHTTCHIRHQT